MQIAACNRNHTVEQRLARWLLMMRERMRDDRIVLTQHFLGAMLGVRRGSMEILDRPGVEAAACACYEALKLPT